MTKDTFREEMKDWSDTHRRYSANLVKYASEVAAWDPVACDKMLDIKKEVDAFCDYIESRTEKAK